MYALLSKFSRLHIMPSTMYSPTLKTLKITMTYSLIIANITRKVRCMNAPENAAAVYFTDLPIFKSRISLLLSVFLMECPLFCIFLRILYSIL